MRPPLVVGHDVVSELQGAPYDLDGLLQVLRDCCKRIVAGLPAGAHFAPHCRIHRHRVQQEVEVDLGEDMMPFRGRLQRRVCRASPQPFAGGM
jgi:hypothetical protein